MALSHILILLAAGFASGILNSVAGGGAFIGFPTLVFLGQLPIVANATWATAAMPGVVASLVAYRQELSKHKALLPYLTIMSLIGGIIGAVLLLHISNPDFAKMVPYLMLGATLIFTFRPQIIRWILRRPPEQTLPPLAFSRYWIGISLLLLPVMIYGGFFGAGLGILILAVLGLMGMQHMHEMNALRTLMAVITNAIAAIIFITANLVSWQPALVVAIGSIAGGYGGAYFARRLPTHWVRNAIIALAWAMTCYFFWENHIIV